MHKSRLGGLIIDCESNDLTTATAFWTRALGYAVRPPADDENAARYVTFDTAPDEPYVELQRVDHPSRVHLDIEADDVDAEARRLEKLGAVRVEKVRDWWVLEAPTGHRFCVVPVERGDFAARANCWDEEISA